MKDMFDRHVAVGDVVTYAVRHGSTMDTRVAQVLVVEDERIRVNVIAGTGYEWERGRWRWDGDTGTSEALPYTGYTAWLRTPHNVLIANGIDALGICEAVLKRQQEHLAKVKG